MSFVFFVQLVCLKKGPLKRVWSVDKSRCHSLPQWQQWKCPLFPFTMTHSRFLLLHSTLTVFCHLISLLAYKTTNAPTSYSSLRILFNSNCLRTSCTPSAWVPHVSLSKQTQFRSAQAGPPDNLSTFAVKMFTKMGLLVPGLCSHFYGSQSVLTINTLVSWGTKGSLCWDIFHSKPQSHQHCCCH